VLMVANKDWQKYGARASGMHLDFVLADAEGLQPLLVIELDDRSHRRADVRRRDEFKNAAIAAASVPLVRVAAAGRYVAAHLRAQFHAALNERHAL
jgi:Protein of unknown function (DUF2726)